MNWEVKNSGKNLAPSECDNLGRKIDVDRFPRRKADVFYRNPAQGISSDSADSSLKNSLAGDLNQKDPSPLVSNNPFYGEIVERLSKLRVDEDKAHSILAINTPTDSVYHRTVHSLAESSCSAILAGGFNEKDDVDVVEGEPSLLNIAINESDESNSDGIAPRSDGNESRGVESFRYVDSLELEREKRSIVVERDSLDSEACYAGRNAAEETSMQNVGHGNSAIRSGVVNVEKSSAKAIVMSNETVAYDIKVIRESDNKRLLVFDNEKKAVSKDNNDNIEQDFSGSESRGEMKYMSLINASEIGAAADLKTPNLATIRFIEDCWKSTPAVGVMADTFGSDLLSDITSLSALSENPNPNGRADGSLLENRGANCCRDNVLKKFSQQFVEAPTEFTAKLISILEESILHTKPGNITAADVSLSRVTEEFRKICREYSKRIEDESMPDFGSFQVSSPPDNESWGRTEGQEEASSLPMHNFTSFGGGKKVYRKTPRRIMKTCSSPNCANIFHRVENAGSDSVRYSESSRNLDNTETFEFWENLCYEMSPTKQAKFQPPSANSSQILSHEDLIRKSDRQMAALDQSCATPSKFGDKRGLISVEKNSPGNYKGIRNENDDSIRNSDKFNGMETRQEIERILAARLVEKRRKCFEEAGKLLKSKQNVDASETIDSKESPRDSGCEAIFYNTLSACVDYLDVFKRLEDHRHSLQCILECSEESAISEVDKTANGKSLKCVEAVIMPVKKSAKYEIQDIESSTPGNNESKMIAEAYLDLSGTQDISAEFDAGQKSFDESFQPSLNCRLSPGIRSPSIVSKKIKRSVSPITRRSLKVAKSVTYSNASQSPATAGSKWEEDNKSLNNRKIGADLSGAKSNPRFPSITKSAANSPGLMDVTNIQKSYQLPKVVIVKATPPTCNSNNKSSRLIIVDENTEVECKRKLNYSETETPEQRKKRYFYTPGKTPTLGRVRPKQKYFETPRQTTRENKLPPNSPSTPGSHRLNYNTVPSPVGMYIRGTNPNLITNVRGKTNERMLTPRGKTPQSKSKKVSPILARSPRLSPKQTETSRLKFKLSTMRKPARQQAPDILNVALCESNPSSSRGTENMSTSPFPKIYYKSAPCVKMVNDPRQQRRGGPKTLANAVQEKIIYRHEGRFNSPRKIEDQNHRDDDSTKNSLTSVSGDVSLWHKRSAAKTNYLCNK